MSASVEAAKAYSDRVSDEINQAVGEAEQNAQEQWERCLDLLIADMPSALDALGREASRAQPNVTIALGPEGVMKLRANLNASAVAINEELIRARATLPQERRASFAAPGESLERVVRGLVGLGVVAETLNAAGYSGTWVEVRSLADSVVQRLAFTNIAGEVELLGQALRRRDNVRDKLVSAAAESLWE